MGFAQSREERESGRRAGWRGTRLRGLGGCQRVQVRSGRRHAQRSAVLLRGRIIVGAGTPLFPRRRAPRRRLWNISSTPTSPRPRCSRETSLLIEFFQRLLMGGEDTATALTEGLGGGIFRVAQTRRGGAAGQRGTRRDVGAAGAAKSISGVETLQAREMKLPVELEEVAEAGGIEGWGGEEEERGGGRRSRGGGGSTSAAASPFTPPLKNHHHPMASSMSSSGQQPHAADLRVLTSASTTPEPPRRRKAVDLSRHLRGRRGAALRLDAEASTPAIRGVEALPPLGDAREGQS